MKARENYKMMTKNEKPLGVKDQLSYHSTIKDNRRIHKGAKSWLPSKHRMDWLIQLISSQTSD